MSWRKRLAPLIAEVLAAHEGAPPAVVRKALREAWTAHLLGPRRYHPYKVWLDEIRRQTGGRLSPRRRAVEAPEEPLPLLAAMGKGQ